MVGRRRAAWSVLVVALWSGAVLARQGQPPARIVSTSPSITETLFALGLGDRVVGVSTYCRFPPAAAKLPKVGTFLKPDAEAIAALRPDLVFVHEVSDGIDRRLSSLRLPFVVVERGSSLPAVYATIRQIAAAARAPERGDRLVADVERKLAVIHQRTPRTPPRVLFIVGRNPGTLTDLIGVGPGSYINDLIGLAGGRNVLDIPGQPEYPRISMETVLRFDPDVIVDTVDMGDTAQERDERTVTNTRLWSAYPMLAAVRARRLYPATTEALVVPGPRVVDAAEWLAGLLRGADRR